MIIKRPGSSADSISHSIAKALATPNHPLMPLNLMLFFPHKNLTDWLRLDTPAVNREDCSSLTKIDPLEGRGSFSPLIYHFARIG